MGQDDKWLEDHTIKKIANDNKVMIIKGGLGNGTCDSNIGSVCGIWKDSINAITALKRDCILSATSDRDDNANTNLSDILNLSSQYFNKEGKIASDFTADKIQSMLNHIREGKIKIDSKLPLEYPGEYPMSPDVIEDLMNQMDVYKEYKVQKEKNIFNVINYKRLNSTQVEAENLIKEGKIKSNTVIRALEQTEGLGQGKQQNWQSGKDNLTFSVISTDKFNVDSIPTTKEIANIVKDVLSIYLEQNQQKKIMVKSSDDSNDIFYDNKKIGGLILSYDTTGNIVSNMICGIGININSFPENLVDKEYKATSLKAEKILLQSDGVEEIMSKISGSFLSHLDKYKLATEYKDKDKSVNTKNNDTDGEMIHKKTELLSECLQDKQQQLLGNDNAEKEKIPIYHKPLNHSLGNYRKRQDITNKIVNNSNVTNPQAHKIIAKNLPKQEL